MASIYIHYLECGFPLRRVMRGAPLPYVLFWCLREFSFSTTVATSTEIPYEPQEPIQHLWFLSRLPYMPYSLYLSLLLLLASSCRDATGSRLLLEADYFRGYYWRVGVIAVLWIRRVVVLSFLPPVRRYY